MKTDAGVAACLFLLTSVISMTSAASTPTRTPTTQNPARCNGTAPPEGEGTQLQMLAPGVLSYTCNTGLVKTAGHAIIHCANLTWSPKGALQCKPPEDDGGTVPHWLWIVAVSIAGAAVIVALLFFLAYVCRVCGVCSHCGGPADSKSTCTCCRRSSRVTTSPQSQPPVSHVKPKESKLHSANDVTSKKLTGPIISYSDYLIKQKDFL